MSRTAKFPIPKPLIDSLEHLQDKSITQSPDFAPYDLSTSVDFLKQYAGNQSTFDAYRREVERLLQWAWLIVKKSLLDFKRQDMEDYIQFCLSPPKSWIGLKKTPRFITRAGERKPNPAWRPFVATITKADHKKNQTPNKQHYQLSQKSVREIFTVLSSFYTYLALEEKVTMNPIALIKQKSKYLQKRQQQSPIMRLSEKQWETCLEVIKNLAEENPEKHERTVFILSALYLMYLRISELVASNRWIPQMGHFYQDAQGLWWFKTVGKGNKSREIAVADDMLAALKRYRKSMQLSPLPSANDKTPLLPKEKGKGPMTSTRHIRKMIQHCFDQAIYKLRETGFSVQADALESATVHWLRHTGISDDINKRGRPIAHVRDDAGHSSSAITDRYNDIELHERHQSAKNKRISKKSNGKNVQ
jgi:site-specific recombinase XerD